MELHAVNDVKNIEHGIGGRLCFLSVTEEAKITRNQIDGDY